MDIRLEQGRVFGRARQRVHDWRNWLATGMICLLTAGLFYKVMFGGNGMVVYQQKKSEYRKLQKEIEDLNKENDQVSGRIKALRTDPEAIEKEAREQLHYAKPGEVIFVNPEPRRPAIPTTADKR